MSEKVRIPRAPNQLGLRGRRLWRRAWTEFEFNVVEEEILEQACRVADQIDRLVALTRDGPIAVKGSRGQIVANPLLPQLRQERVLLRSYLSSLGLPDDANETSWDGLSASDRARRAAHERWRKGK